MQKNKQQTTPVLWHNHHVTSALASFPGPVHQATKSWAGPGYEAGLCTYLHEVRHKPRMGAAAQSRSESMQGKIDCTAQS